MDIYHLWCDLEEGVDDLAFVNRLHGWLGHLEGEGRIAGYRVTRRKLGLAPDGLGEFHIMIETRDMAQLEEAFLAAAAREGEADRLHSSVNSLVRNLKAALYRDFPDEVRAEP